MRWSEWQLRRPVHRRRPRSWPPSWWWPPLSSPAVVASFCPLTSRPHRRRLRLFTFLSPIPVVSVFKNVFWRHHSALFLSLWKKNLFWLFETNFTRRYKSKTFLSWVLQSYSRNRPAPELFGLEPEPIRWVSSGSDCHKSKKNSMSYNNHILVCLLIYLVCLLIFMS